MTSYELPDIPAHVAGKHATLTVGDTTVNGVVSSVSTYYRMDDGESRAIIEFDRGLVCAYVRESTPHMLEVED